jgi:hypothetical protein
MNSAEIVEIVKVISILLFAITFLIIVLEPYKK